MTEKILKAMENAGIVHYGYKPDDHVIYGMLGSVTTREFYERVCQTVNPLFEKKGLEYSLRNNQLILTRNHHLSRIEFRVATIVPFLKVLPITVRPAGMGERPYTFDDNGNFLTDQKQDHTSYEGLANLLHKAAKSALKHSD